MAFCFSGPWFLACQDLVHLDLELFDELLVELVLVVPHPVVDLHRVVDAHGRHSIWLEELLVELLDVLCSIPKERADLLLDFFVVTVVDLAEVQPLNEPVVVVVQAPETIECRLHGRVLRLVDQAHRRFV